MKTYLLLFLLFTFLKSEELTNGNEACVTCISDPTKKLCQSGPRSPDRYCCDKTEFSVNCGSGTFGKCSDTLEDIGTDGKYLLCENAFECQPNKYTVIASYDSGITTTGVPQNGVCVIEVRNGEWGSEGIVLENRVQNDVDVHVFEKDAEEEFSYLGRFRGINEEGEQDTSTNGYDVPYLNSAIFVVVPNNNRVGGFSANAIALNSAESPYDGLSLGAILGISFGSLLLLIVCLLVVICCCKRCKSKARMKKLNEGVYQKVDDELSSPLAQSPELPAEPYQPQNAHQPQPTMPQNPHSTVQTGIPIHSPSPISPPQPIGAMPTQNKCKEIDPSAPVGGM